MQTLIVCKPFALACVLFLMSLMNATVRKKAKYYSVGFALSLLASVIMKRIFIIGFIPVAAGYIVFKKKQIKKEVC